MHLHLILLAQSTTTTTAKSSKSSGSYLPLLVIVVIFALVYFLFLRPRQQRLRQQQTGTRDLSIGDEVMSAGGIFGRVVALDADAVEVEVAPGVVMTFVRRAISLRPQPSGGATGRTAATPVDEPWPTEPGGPGDTAGPTPPPPTDQGGAGESGGQWPGRAGDPGEGSPPAAGASGA